MIREEGIDPEEEDETGEQMTATAAWPQLLWAIKQHGNNLQYMLAVHTSMCAQPRTAEALVTEAES